MVGASYSGTGLVAQLRALADAAAEQMGFDPADVKFVLLDLAEQVMPEVGKKLGEGAMRVLRQRGIDVRLGLTLKEVHSDHVVLSDDSRIDTHTVAWVTAWVDPAGRCSHLRCPAPIRRGRRRRVPTRRQFAPPRSTRFGKERCWDAMSPPASATGGPRTTGTGTWVWSSISDRATRSPIR